MTMPYPSEELPRLRRSGYQGFYQRRFNKAMDAGFLPEEATWIAENRIRTASGRGKRLLRRRRAMVDELIRMGIANTVLQAAAWIANRRRAMIASMGVDRDPNDVFYDSLVTLGR